MFISARDHKQNCNICCSDQEIATDSALNQNLKGNVACVQISWEENDMYANPTKGNLWTS